MSVVVKMKGGKLEPGQVCGACSLRAPPIHRCSYCRREVADWPQDEEWFLEQAGWERNSWGTWQEPNKSVMGRPTEKMTLATREQVTGYEAQLKHFKSDPLRRADLEAGLTKARERVALYESGLDIQLRNREHYTQAEAVMLEWGKTWPYEPRPKVKEVPTFTEAQLGQFEEQLRMRSNGMLLKGDEAQLRERRKQTSKVHHQMCPECRQY